MFSRFLTINTILILFPHVFTDRLGQDWNINAPCQPYIEKFSLAISKMAECAANYTSPPKVCTQCIDQYINFKEMEYTMKHLNNVTATDKTPCSQVIYGQYLLSYVHEMANSLSRQIWDNSRCDSCLVIKWDFEGGDSRIIYDEKTVNFHNKLTDWRKCAINDTPTAEGDICKRCTGSFDELFNFYWKIYTEPGVDFCLDVETTMNDTMNIWHSIWKCPDDSKNDRKYDTTMVYSSTAAFILVIIFFYVGSYIQAEKTVRQFEDYSARPPIQIPRSRLISSSTFNDQVSDYSSLAPSFSIPEEN
uniref:Osteopetrosis-associated transmembrane protein 1 n=1 Tax=Rhabditophanes sp. KR3021 TaxID=114890 RepID=A0AC35U0E4_9BILA